jgi:hypothetical protein
VKGSGRLDEAVPQGRGHLRSRSPRTRSQEKPTPDDSHARTKTDTGRRDEDSKALERTLVKELGKLTP